MEGEDGLLVIARSGVWVFGKSFVWWEEGVPGSTMCRFMSVDA